MERLGQCTYRSSGMGMHIGINGMIKFRMAIGLNVCSQMCSVIFFMLSSLLLFPFGIGFGTFSGWTVARGSVSLFSHPFLNNKFPSERLMLQIYAAKHKPPNHGIVLCRFYLK